MREPQTIDFINEWPEGYELRIGPTLPTVTIKRDKIEYKITDMRYLNSVAAKLLGDIIIKAAEHGKMETITYELPEGCDENEIRVIIDIVMGASVTAVRKGKNGWKISTRLIVTGAKRLDNALTFDIIKDHARYIYEYAQENNITELGYHEIAMMIADRTHSEFSEHIK